MAEADERKMSFLEHLTELRTRIIWSLVPAGIGLFVAFHFSDHHAVPLAAAPEDHELVFLAPTESFWTT